MQTKRSTAHVLGVMVTDREVQAVLLQKSSDGLQLVRRFSRQRAASHAAGTQAGMPVGMPQLQEEGAVSEDFTIQFGDGPGSNDLFLSAEFGGMNPGGSDKAEGGERAAMTASFELELGDILAECRDAGYEDLTTAFCIGAVDTTHVELRVSEVKKKKGLGGKKGDAKKDEAKKEEIRSSAKANPARQASRAQLLQMLAEQHEGQVDEECVAFLPMTSTEEGLPRYLAVLPKANDPVSVTLRSMREQRGRRLPAVRMLDTEASLYLGLGRAALQMEPPSRDVGEGGEETEERFSPPNGVQNTLIVRVGADDTIVMFMQGRMLQHFENLRSLTAYDSPETICSRVLLQQDAHAIGEVRRILISSEERERELAQSFEMFFPDARVELMQTYLPPSESSKPMDAISSTTVAAVGAALRLLDDDRYQRVFEDVNLLAKQLMKRRLYLPITWHGLVVAALLFCTVLFFMARYFSMEHEINEYRVILKEYPPEIKTTDVRVLQARIDSLQAVYSGYMRALTVLDTLLVGSDAWSRALEQISSESAAVRGIWIETWRPEENYIHITGTSTARDRVVSFAERTGGIIRELTFSEIREWPVYAFTMTIPLKVKLPEAAQYLRARAQMSSEEGSLNGQAAQRSGSSPAPGTETPAAATALQP